MEDERFPSGYLRAGRRELEGMAGVRLLQDLTWSDRARRWVLWCRLAADVSPHGPVDAQTEWYVLIGDDYPWGTIGFYPAKQRGITNTFPHQDFNAPGSDAVDWREGKLCLDTSVGILGRHGQNYEPASADWRLAWHFHRALCWLKLASQGVLLAPGDPFELPIFPKGEVLETVAFAEGEEEFGLWQAIPDQSGIIEYTYLNARPPALVIRSFLSTRRRSLLSPAWGRVVSDGLDSTHLGLWVRLPQVLVMPPWQAPATWGELRQVCDALDVSLDRLIDAAARPIRVGGQHIAVIGWPVPATIGGVPCRMHWQAMRLPVLSHGKQSAKGFRPQMGGYARRDRMEVLRDDMALGWVSSENWHSSQLSARGKLPDELASQRFLLIGAGALGSAMAEMLIRGGVRELLILDPDVLVAGNLVRHTLGMRDLQKSKASALAQHLNLVSPHAGVTALDGCFPPPDATAHEAVRGCGVIIDCTGSEELPYWMTEFDWGDERHFLSFSMGLYAQRLYCFSAHTKCFPHEAFSSALEPWLYDDRERYSADELPWEGIGCWHPVFPARVDDVWLLAAAGVKLLERALTAPQSDPKLVVLEQFSGADGSPSVRVAELRGDRD